MHWLSSATDPHAQTDEERRESGFSISLRHALESDLLRDVAGLPGSHLLRAPSAQRPQCYLDPPTHSGFSGKTDCQELPIEMTVF